MRHSITENMFYCDILLLLGSKHRNQTTFAHPALPPTRDNKSINLYFIYFRGVLPNLYQNDYPWLACILALNATKKAIRLGG